MKWFQRISIVILSLCAVQPVFAQSLEIESFDVSNYPTIRAYIKGIDTINAEIREYTNSQFEVVDGGKARTVTENYCEKRKKRFSLILTIDRTGSMTYPLDVPGNPTPRQLATNAANKLIDALNFDVSECCITSFASGNADGSKLEQGFTKNTDSLHDAINNIDYIGMTNLNMAFFGTNDGIKPGALDMIEKAQYQPVILMLADGEHEPNFEEFRAAEVTAFALDKGVPIYIVTLGLPVPDNLNGIAVQTGGTANSSYDQESLDRLFSDIRKEAELEGDQIPCHIEWESDCDGGDVDITLDRFGGVSATSNYDATDVMPHIGIATRDYYFENIAVGSNKEQIIEICAEKNDIIFNGSGYTSSDGQYAIVDWDGSPTPPARVNKGECINATVRFTPTDTVCSEPDFSFDASACTGLDLNLSGGYIYAEPVNVGSTTLGQQKDVVKLPFCNKTCETITINNVTKFGGDASDFLIVSPKSFPFSLPPDSCLEITFGFKPTVKDSRSSNYRVSTSSGIFVAPIVGSGSGQPEISVIDSYDFEAIDCTEEQKCTLIEISNPGALDLEVTSIDFSSPDFSLNPDETPFTIEPGGNRTVNVCFSTANAVPQSAIMTVRSNADNDPDKEITLSGVWNEYAFLPAVTTIDLGLVCPGENVIRTLRLNNIGSVDVDVTGTVTGDFTLSTNSWTLPGGGQEIGIDFMSNTEGPINETLTLTNVICGTEQEILLTGGVAEPKVTGNPPPMQATVGFFDTKTFTITNESSMPCTFGLSTNDTQFEIDVPNPPANISLGANASTQVTITFRPTTSAPVNARLLISGQPCDFNDILMLVGAADIATADLSVGQYSGLAGQTITIPVELGNKFQFVPSGTTTIDYELSFDPDLLESLPPNIATNGVLPISMPTGGASDETYDIDFLVLNGNGKTSTPLELSSISPNGAVVISPEPGSFDLIVASAIISINKNLSAEPGDKFEIPIVQKNGKNISKFHEGITTELRFNYTLLEPLFATASSNIDLATGERTITIDNLPIDQNSGVITLESYPFRAMLGNAESTDIFIQNTASKTGEIIFTLEDGRFSLLNVCKNANGSIVRLFDPEGRNSLAAPNPNPITGVANLKVELREEGPARIWLCDMGGRKVMEVINGTYPAGHYSFPINTSKLESGSYLIILETEYRTLSTRMEIIK